MRFLSTFVFALFACFGVSNSARGDIILDNLGTAVSNELVGFETSVGISIGFTMSGTSLNLDSVQLELRANFAPGGNATLALRNDVGGNPDTVNLVSLGSQAVTQNTFSVFTFNAPANVQLNANTKYWLTIGTDMTSPNGLVLQGRGAPSSPNNYATLSGLNSGFYNNQNVDVSGFFSPPGFRINGSLTAVPEPTSLGVALIAFGAMGMRIRNRRKRLQGKVT